MKQARSDELPEQTRIVDGIVQRHAGQATELSPSNELIKLKDTTRLVFHRPKAALAFEAHPNDWQRICARHQTGVDVGPRILPQPGERRFIHLELEDRDGGPIDRGACLKHVPYGTRLRHSTLLQGHRFSTASGVLSLEQARAVGAEFVEHYNAVRLHGAIGYVTPQARLEGRAEPIWQDRDTKLEAARARRREKRAVQKQPEFTGDAACH